MEVMAADLSQQQTNLENTLADMRSRIADFDSRLADAKAQAAAQLDQLTEATQNVVASAQTGNGGGGKPSSSTNNSTQKPGNNTNNNVANNGNSGNHPTLRAGAHQIIARRRLQSQAMLPWASRSRTGDANMWGILMNMEGQA